MVPVPATARGRGRGAPAAGSLAAGRAAAALAVAFLAAACTSLPLPRPASPTPPGSPPPTAIAARPAVLAAAASVVKVVAIMPACGHRTQDSGFVFAPQHVLTVAYAVAGAARSSLRVVTAAGQAYPAAVVLFDPGTDIAVLDVPGLRIPARQLAGEPRYGTAVAAAGFVRDGAAPMITTGWTGAPFTASGRHPDGPGAAPRRLVVTTARVSTGSPGGPLLDRSGRVTGMVFAQAVPSGTYALTASQLRPAASTGAHLTAAAPDGSCR